MSKKFLPRTPTKRNVGDLVEIFWIDAEGNINDDDYTKDPPLCRTRGTVFEVSRVEIKIEYSVYLNREKPPMRDHTRIPRGCITKWRIIEPHSKEKV